MSDTTQRDLEAENRTLRALVLHALGLLATNEIYLPTFSASVAGQRRLMLDQDEAGVRAWVRDLGS